MAIEQQRWEAEQARMDTQRQEEATRLEQEEQARASELERQRAAEQAQSAADAATAARQAEAQRTTGGDISEQDLYRRNALLFNAANESEIDGFGTMMDRYQGIGYTPGGPGEMSRNYGKYGSGAGANMSALPSFNTNQTGGRRY